MFRSRTSHDLQQIELSDEFIFVCGWNSKSNYTENIYLWIYFFHGFNILIFSGMIKRGNKSKQRELSLFHSIRFASFSYPSNFSVVPRALASAFVTFLHPLTPFYPLICHPLIPLLCGHFNPVVICSPFTSHRVTLVIPCPTLFQITPGSKASVANLCPGDVILAIEGAPATDMLHCEAQNKIKESTNQLCLTVERFYAETTRTQTGGGCSKRNTCRV